MLLGLNPVLIQGLDQRGPPHLQVRRGVLARLRRELFLRGRPHRRGQPPSGRGGEHLDDDLDLPQRAVPGRVDLRRRRQLRGQHAGVDPDPLDGLLGHGDPPLRVGPCHAAQIRQRCGGGIVAALGEGPAALQVGQRDDKHPLQQPGRAFTGGEQRQQLGVGGVRAADRGQLGDGLLEQAVRGDQRYLGHGPIILEQVFDGEPLVVPGAPFTEYRGCFAHCSACLPDSSAEGSRCGGEDSLWLRRGRGLFQGRIYRSRLMEFGIKIRITAGPARRA